jgi:Flp pilus assembly protein TadD
MRQPADPKTFSKRRLLRGTVIGAVVAAAALGVLFAAMNLAGFKSGGPGGEGSQKQLAELHESAQHLILSNQVPQAKLVIQRLLKGYPNDAEAHVLMAKVLMAEGMGDAAYAEVAQSLQLDATRDDVQFLAGTFAEKSGLVDKAKYHYLRAGELAPKNARYPMYLGQLLMKTNDLDGAQMQLLRAKSLDSSLSVIYSMLAEIASRQGKLDMAVDQVNKALEQTEPDSEKYLAFMLQKAQLLRRANHPEDALRVLLTLAPRDQQKPAVVDHIATTYLMLGKPTRAAAVWTELFAIDPKNQTAAAEAGLAFVRAGDTAHARQYLEYARQFSDANPKMVALEEVLKEKK